jgi:hypothetical protein
MWLNIHSIFPEVVDIFDRRDIFHLKFHVIGLELQIFANLQS